MKKQGLGLDGSNKNKEKFGYIEVAKEKTDLIWPKVWPHLEKVIALSHGEISEESVKKRIKSGEAKMFVIIQEGEIIAVLTLEMRTFETGTTALYVPIIGGTKMEVWGDEFYGVVENIAKNLGCHEIRGIAVRNGWLPVMRKKGWQEVHTVISKKVEY